MRFVVARLFTVLTVAILFAPPSHAQATPFVWPLEPRPLVVRPFDPPEREWLPGHRGVDLAGREGQSVRAAGDGVVVFAGIVATKPVVSVDHPSGLRTTYEPVVSSVTPGSRVRGGDVIGTLASGHAGCVTPCLHWGVRRDRTYLDPLALMRTTPIRLKPLTPS
ncbi:M23 family metallopeptidase [Rhodococcus sovatensis]|uniref:M23 family metallopeptidase n=1 Tax=Rhodococcus sovatensis TaxID=1805840 RepID=A0ABZ2PQC6_9NOCA